MILRNDISIGNLSDVGREREENQDYFGYYEAQNDREFQKKGRLIIVADGMGGHAGGKAASRLAVEAIKNHYLADSTHNIPNMLRESIEKANKVIHQKSTKEKNLEGMGTTCSCMAIHDGLAYIAHVGDSRIYQVRNNQVKQLTQDHSWVAQMLRDGLLTPEEAENHPKSNIILRSVGSKRTVEVDLYNPIRLMEGDIYLFCSDGLTGLVNDEEILEILSVNKPQPACQQLVNLANQRGGYDNITVQVIRINSVADVTATDQLRVPDSMSRQDKMIDQKMQPSPPIQQTPKPAKLSNKIFVSVICLLLIIIGGGFYTFYVSQEPNIPKEPLVPKPDIAEPPPKPVQNQFPNTPIAEKNIILQSVNFKYNQKDEYLYPDENSYFAAINGKDKIISIYFTLGGKIYLSTNRKNEIPAEISFSKIDYRSPDGETRGLFNDQTGGIYLATYYKTNNQLGIRHILTDPAKKNVADQPLIVLQSNTASGALNEVDPDTVFLSTHSPKDFSFFPINDHIFLVSLAEGSYFINTAEKKVEQLEFRGFIPPPNFLANVLYLPKNDTIIFFSKAGPQYSFFQYTPQKGIEQRPEMPTLLLPQSLGITYRSKSGLYYVFSREALIAINTKQDMEAIKYIDSNETVLTLDRIVKDPDSKLLLGVQFQPHGRTKIFRIQLNNYGG
jgi:PPM family protein phosphatase